MKFVIADKRPKGIECVALTLRQDDDGCVCVEAVDEIGEVISSLCVFDIDGTLEMCPYVRESLGFELTVDREIKTF